MSSTRSYEWKPQRSRFFGTVYVPVCTLSVRDRQDRWRDIEVIVDSGAVVTLLKRSFGDWVGLNVPSGKPIRLSGITPPGVEAFVHDLAVRIADHEMTVPVAVASDDAPPNLLGRIGTFERLMIELDGPSRTTSFRR
jgi:hypothetical protein